MSENKLITLAIRTVKRAEQIREELERNGIETVIQHIDDDLPLINIGVRVRIKEADLPLALQIVEEREKEWENQKDTMPQRNHSVLIPVDFTDVVHSTVDLGFTFAQALQAEVVFLHVYYIPAFTITETSIYSLKNSELLRKTMQQVKEERENFDDCIQRRIADGSLPKVPFRIGLAEGVADNEIIEYCRRHRPELVVMGTHGTKKISDELIGSVAGEVLEACIAPVFAVPEQSAVRTTTDIRRIAFLTNFEEKDLIAIDSMLALFQTNALEVFFLHISEKDEAWNEIMLSGIKDYFSTHYPNIKAYYDKVNAEQRVQTMRHYISKRKIDLLAFNSRRRNMFVRLFNPSLAYKMILNADTPLFVTHI